MSSIFVGDPPDRVFERLYERYVREVYRYVLATVRNPAEAEDVTQTTFLNAYRALQAGAEPRAPHNWLIAIAHNTCRSSVRRSMRRPREVPLGDAELAAAEPEGTNVRELLRAMGRLPFNQRSALTMRELEGRTYPEIAETLGVTVPAVEALIARARRTLRTQLGTVRGLAALLLPRSLRKLSENGEVAAGAFGAGVTAKAAALVLVGIAGFASVEAGGLREVRTPPPPVRQGAPSLAVSPPQLASAPRAGAASPQRQRSRVFSSRSAARPGKQTVTGTAPVAASVHPAATEPAGSATASTAGSGPGVGSAPAQDPAGAAQQTANGAVATVAATVPQTPTVQTPTVQAPTVQTPPVQAPTLPVDTPQLPPPPAVPVQTPGLPVTVPPPPVQPPPLP